MEGEAAQDVTLDLPERTCHELSNVGAAAGGPRAEALMDLGRPDIDWVSLARTFGITAIFRQ